MTRILHRLVCGGVCGLLLPAVASAQTEAPDPVSTARIQLGPVGLTPRLALRNIGLDTNVFNASETPERDFTAALVPGADTWLRVGRLLVSSKSSLEWTYFHEATSQRSLNFSQEGRLDLDLFRVVPYVSGSYIRTRQRPNLEIDQRVQQKQTGGAAGVVVHPGSRLQLQAGVRQNRYDFGGTKFGDANLARLLNRESSEGALTMKYKVTPLTTFVLEAATRYDRFEFARERDADSISVVPGFDFNSLALIAGSARVGFRRFETRDAAIVDYSGLVAAVDIKYLAGDMMQLAYRANRDVDYSFDQSQPFYVATTQAVELTQALGYDWDVVGRLEFGRLAYHGAAPTGTEVLVKRTDRIRSYGTGFGRRLGDALRIGLDVDYATRVSSIDSRTFDGFRIGGSVTYGQ